MCRAYEKIVNSLNFFVTFCKFALYYIVGYFNLRKEKCRIPIFENFLMFLKNFFVTFFENALYYIVGVFNLKTKKCRNTHIWKFFNVFEKVFVILGWICTILYCRVFNPKFHWKEWSENITEMTYRLTIFKL